MGYLRDGAYPAACSTGESEAGGVARGGCLGAEGSGEGSKSGGCAHEKFHVHMPARQTTAAAQAQETQTHAHTHTLTHTLPPTWPARCSLVAEPLAYSCPPAPNLPSFPSRLRAPPTFIHSSTRAPRTTAPVSSPPARPGSPQCQSGETNRLYAACQSIALHDII